MDDFLVQGSDCAGPSQAPNFFAFQLTLSQPGGAHHPHQVVRATPDFQTLRRPCLRQQLGTAVVCREKITSIFCILRIFLSGIRPTYPEFHKKNQACDVLRPEINMCGPKLRRNPSLNTQSCNRGLLVVRDFCFWAV